MLLTHGPPFGILDIPPDQEERMGDPELRNRVRELSCLKLHAFGHIHGAYGAFEQDDVTFANVALMGHFGDLVQGPTVLRMRSRRD